MDKNPIITIFEELLVPSPSGGERVIAQNIRRKLRDMGYTHKTDAAGNVIVHLRARKPDKPLMILSAHMDEISMIVTNLEPNGDLRIAPSGGLYPWKIGEGPVDIFGDLATIQGILSMGSTHTQTASEKIITWKDIRIITGLNHNQLQDAGVRPGTALLLTKERRGPVIFGDDDDPLIGAWTFDDRMGCATLLRLLEKHKNEALVPNHPTIIAFTTREEIGGHGAKYLVRSTNPEVFISIDGCPIPPGASLEINGQPGIWSKDRVAQYDQDLLITLSKAAHKSGTKLQPAVYDDAASDASLVSYALGVPKIVCLGHVRENSHGFEVARLSVFDNLLNILVEFIKTYDT